MEVEDSSRWERFLIDEAPKQDKAAASAESVRKSSLALRGLCDVYRLGFVTERLFVAMR